MACFSFEIKGKTGRQHVIFSGQREYRHVNCNFPGQNEIP